jgi:Ca-activated chloride channel homolog
MSNIEFANIEWLWLLILLPLLGLYYYFILLKKTPSLHYSSLNYINKKNDFKSITRHSLPILRLTSLGLLFIALARPQSSSSWQNVTTEGIDIVIALDISGSMLAQDFKPNRLEASKAVGIDFIQKRPNDRIGLVVYAGESFTQSPLTTDHSVLKNLFKDIQYGLINDGTAIGLGVSNSCK